MRKPTRIAIAVGATAAVAGPAAFVLAAPASADIEKGGSCHGARYELSVDREHGGFDVDADIDGAAPGSKWRVVMKHDGKAFVRTVRTADHEGDVEIDRHRPNTAGKDHFVLKVKKVGTKKACTTSITTR